MNRKGTEEMKKILIISPTGGYAGIDACLETLVCGMDKTRYTPILVFPKNAMLKPRFEEMGILCYELPINWWFPIGFSGSDLLHVLPTLREKVDPLIHIIKDNSVDIVFTNTSVCYDGAVAAAICDVPHLFFIHAQYVDNIYTGMQQETKEFLYMLMGNLSYKLVCCSKLLYEYISQYSNNVMYIYNGVDIERFKYKKRNLGKKNKLDMVCVGHYNANKQQDFVLNALKALKRMRPDLMSHVTFTMIGPGETNYQEKLKDIVKEYGLENQVVFEGFRNDIHSYLDNFNLYVNSSITENLPVSVIEAMSCGMPVLGTPNDGTIQLIQDGITGYITNTPEVMAKKIINLLEHPEVLEYMSEEGRKRAETLFSSRDYVRNFEKLFDEINASCSKGSSYATYINGFYESVVGTSLLKYPKKRVLVIYPPQAMATYYIAAKNPLDFLMKMDLVEYINVVPQQFKIEDLADVDIIYCLRYYDDFVYGVLKTAKKMNKPFIWFIDDNYSALKFENNQVLHKQFTNELYERMYKDSSAVIVNSGNLYRFGRQFTDKIFRLPTYQVNNDALFLEFEHSNDVVTMGFMGTLMRDGDFECVIPALKKIIKVYGERVRVEFIGYCPESLKGYLQVKNFDFIDDYNEFRNFFASRKWDIGLGPLKDTEFNRSKTNNKYREYSSFRIASIFSKMTAYNFCVKDGFNGLLVENTEEAWYEAIKKLLDDPKLRETIAINAWEDVRKNYSIEKFAKGLMDIFCRNEKMPTSAYCGASVEQQVERSIHRPYDPEMLCFSKAIKKPRKYNVFCELPIVNRIGILFGQEEPSKGNVTIKVYFGKHLLRTVTKSLRELNYTSWNYFYIDSIYGAAGKVLTLEISINALSGTVGVFEDKNKRPFWYKVFNKMGFPLKGMDALMVDFQS